ncbi:Gfo/Idh/MocA family oxidoreductase [Arthrobacter sp. EH-1B-1]|uniref:Gfo/Idh/MocA family oxidoreductase n=1 Tax=Arthrobacter vasquezii TaxID=2977629 RepID=A0ABT6CZZ7_9MICC|nr:Gfo/Idh/MocA family oxidoreductase [Arthrobacter vasquezii]MDF9279042.1 Gfo/Idh/MocA family oxidoreductase [Arthrobacter vasquezii]
MTRILRAAVLGTGAVAHLHAEALAAIDGVTAVASADPSEERVRDFNARHGIAAGYGTLEELLAKEAVDVVHICTPPAGHAEQTKAAFDAGAHVIAEKPPALSLAEVDAMQSDAVAADRKLAVVFQQRTGTAAAHIRNLLQSGELGRPLTAVCHTHWYRGPEYFDVPWRGTWETEGGGTTLSHGIHQIDLLAYLLGEWSSVSGQLFRLDRELETEDTSCGVVVFECGAVASVLSTVLAPRESSLIRIDTEHATIELEHLYGHNHASWKLTPARHISAERSASWALPSNEVPSGHDALLSEVYESLLAGADVPPVAADPARAIEIVAALYASAGRGAPVTRGELAAPDFRGSMRAPVTDLRPGR